MSRIRGKDTGPEKLLAGALADRGLKWESHARDLPGRPDFVFRHARVVVLVHGDFWHGWKFEDWRHKLSEKWEEKIASNRRRDRMNERALRETGWRIVRIWEHQIEANIVRCAWRVIREIRAASRDFDPNRDVDAAVDARQRVDAAAGDATVVDQGT